MFLFVDLSSTSLPLPVTTRNATGTPIFISFISQFIVAVYVFPSLSNVFSYSCRNDVVPGIKDPAIFNLPTQCANAVEVLISFGKLFLGILFSAS